jgi:hypothetical protein
MEKHNCDDISMSPNEYYKLCFINYTNTNPDYNNFCRSWNEYPLDKIPVKIELTPKGMDVSSNIWNLMRNNLHGWFQGKYIEKAINQVEEGNMSKTEKDGRIEDLKKLRINKLSDIYTTPLGKRSIEPGVQQNEVNTYFRLKELSYLCIGDNDDMVDPKILKKLYQPENHSETKPEMPEQYYINPNATGLDKGRYWTERTWLISMDRFNKYLDHAIEHGTTTRILIINTADLINGMFSQGNLNRSSRLNQLLVEFPGLWRGAKCVGIRRDEKICAANSMCKWGDSGKISPQPVFQCNKKFYHKDKPQRYWQFVFGLGIGGLWNDVKLKTKATEPDGVDIYEWKMWGGKRKTNKKKPKKSKKVKKNKRKSKKSKTKKK